MPDPSMSSKMFSLEVQCYSGIEKPDKPSIFFVLWDDNTITDSGYHKK
jgi:hypothetical protein